MPAASLDRWSGYGPPCLPSTPNGGQEGAVMRLRLQPRDTTFFDLFTDAGANISACVEVLREFVTAPPERRQELAARMHEVEHAGDETTHTILNQLNRAFIT